MAFYFDVVLYTLCLPNGVLSKIYMGLKVNNKTHYLV